MGRYCRGGSGPGQAMVLGLMGSFLGYGFRPVQTRPYPGQATVLGLRGSCGV
jgi:hypothetical protein